MATTLLLQTDAIQSIPVLTIALKGAERKPVIFFISGFGGCKEDGLRLGYQLAQAGFFFIGSDAWRHGERVE